MNYALCKNPLQNDDDCLVLGLLADEPLPDFAKTLNIKPLCARLQEVGDSLWQYTADKSIFIIQFGDKKSFNFKGLQKGLSDIVDALIKQKIVSATLCLPHLTDETPDWQLEQMILKIDNQQYQFLDFKKKSKKTHALKDIHFYCPGASDKPIETAKAIASGAELTRNLGNMPANVCTPSFLGEQAELLANQYPSIRCKILKEEEMRQMGMNTILAVAQGSQEPPRFIEIQYSASGDAAPIVLVGKGITFDSGGLCLKLGNFIEEMKYDMLGAATVLGTIKACALLKLPINVIGLIASAENMPSGTAVKSGDVVTSLSGQSVEIINTDAEGRLVLADALTYAERFKPKFVIDIATLTGAIIVSLGNVHTGLFTQDESLAELILKAAAESRDRVWRMPLDEDYQEAIKSPIADMLNAGFDRTAGSITAACFLSRFTEKYPWAHLDIAGTAWNSGKLRNATGRPVYLLSQLLRHVANSR